MKKKKEQKQKPIITSWDESSFNYDLTLFLLGLGTIGLLVFLFLHRCNIV